MGNRFVIFSPGYNCKEWIKNHMEAVQNQTYKNYIHVIVDDATTDGTYEEILKYADDRTVVYRNEKNMGWAYNAATYLDENITSPEDIVIGYDLDDWFNHIDVLKRLDTIYVEHECWVTYGGFLRSNKMMTEGNWDGYPEEVIKARSFKNHRWRFWALRTWKGFLWEAINKEDFKGPAGEWPKTTYDYAIGFPLLELCPPERLHHVGEQEVLYIYNYENPLNDKKINKEQQQTLGKYYLSREEYKIYDYVLECKRRVIQGVPILPDIIVDPVKETRFIIFSAGANCKSFIDKHMESVKSQKYTNYVHIVVNDYSLDNTSSKIAKYGHKKMRVYKNAKSLKWLENAVNYLPQNILSPDDIILVLDLDDWLAHDRVLEKINYVYHIYNCWLTYGQFRQEFSLDTCLARAKENRDIIKLLGLDYRMIVEKTTEKARNIKNIHKVIKPSGPILPDILEEKKYREENTYEATHPKTFKAFLWNRINKNDFKGPDGQYAPCCYDRALMYPMLEMCPADKIRFINEVLYIYNSSNPLCVGWGNRSQQIKYETWFRNKPKYEELKLEDLS